MTKRKDVVQTSAPGDFGSSWDGQLGDSNPDVAPLVRVRFLKRDAPFDADEEREFPALEAQKFIRQGVAEEVVGG